MTDWLTVAALLAVVVVIVYERLTDSEGSRVEAAREAYANDEITLDEFERRVEEAVDPEVDKIRAAVEPINGVGPATSSELARSFETVEELERADREEIEAVHNVGESTAMAIQERLRN